MVKASLNLIFSYIFFLKNQVYLKVSYLLPKESLLRFRWFRNKVQLQGNSRVKYDFSQNINCSVSFLNFIKNQNQTVYIYILPSWIMKQTLVSHNCTMIYLYISYLFNFSPKYHTCIPVFSCDWKRQEESCNVSALGYNLCTQLVGRKFKIKCRTPLAKDWLFVFIYVLEACNQSRRLLNMICAVLWH